MTVIACVLAPAGIAPGVSLKVDVGVCGPVQQGWIPLPAARGKLNKNVGGTNIDVMIGTGPTGTGRGGECRCDSGSKHRLAAVETTYIKKDARRNARSPKTDICLILRDLEPGARYTLYTYHHRWDQDEHPITNIIVTGATDVTKPDIIYQKPEIMDHPAKFVFTAGTEDVVIRFQCPQRGQPFLNGFELYGGSATVQFASPASAAKETTTSVTIPVNINDANAGATYTVDYATTPGSATPGQDYRPVSGRLVFGPGVTTRNIKLDIVDDDLDEDNETVAIELSNPTGPNIVLGEPARHVHTIVDPRPEVFFARQSGSAMEEKTPAYVPVKLSAPTRKTVTVNYEVVGGTATSGVDYTLEPGKVVFEPGRTACTIPITIIDDNDHSEGIETIKIKLSNPKNALLGKNILYTHIIVSEPVSLKVDLAIPTCDKKGIYEGTAKPGWTIWAAPAWADMYMHDGVWLPSRKDPKAFEAGIEGTGIKAFLSTGSEGQLGIGVKGVCRANLGGGGCPHGKAQGDPIANSWAYAVDWAGPYAGDIILLLKDLPAGRYELRSYHNHWEPCKQKTRNCLDCDCGMPPMPLISANPLPAKQDEPRQDRSENILTGYRWNLPPGTGGGVKAIRNAYDVAPQHVYRDEELVPSTIEFETDGSEVLVIYQADRSKPLYPDCARKGREGARGILNAFELTLLEPK